MPMKEWVVADYLPHAAPMILLDQVLEVHDTSLLGRISGHKDPNHPLLHRGSLPSISAVEMAAQACAVHGALMQEQEHPPASPRPGVLALMRNIEWTQATLEGIDASLDIEVFLLNDDALKALYRFELRAADEVLVKGDLAVFFKP